MPEENTVASRNESPGLIINFWEVEKNLFAPGFALL
jgi:hypothetical protein